jgi:hypothetical protein
MATFPDRKVTIKVLHTLQCEYPTSNLSILMAKFPDRKATIKVLHTLQCVYPTAPAHPDGQVPGQEGLHQSTAHLSYLHLPILMAKFPDRKATIKVLHTLQCMYPTFTCPS